MFNSPLSDEFDQIMPLWPKAARPGGHMFYVGLYRENIKKSSCLNSLGLEF